MVRRPLIFVVRRQHFMELEQLESLINCGDWFAHCGQFQGELDDMPLSQVASSDEWQWLPTSREQDDQLYGTRLLDELASNGKEESRRQAEMSVTRCVLAALRSVPDILPALIDGPHDFTPAAKAGAVFAARMAAREVLVGRPEIWCRVVRLFVAGYWPCGWSPTTKGLVVL